MAKSYIIKIAKANIILFGTSNSGKTTTLKILHYLLVGSMPPAKTPRVQITYKGLTIDIAFNGDDLKTVEQNVAFFKANPCDIAVSPTRTKGGPVKVMNDFVNKNFQPDKDDYYHYYRLVHSQDSGDILEGLHLVFIELPKFKAKNLAETKMQVLWLRFLTEIDEKAKKAPADLLDNRETCQALEIVEESAYSEAEMLAYDRYWDQVRLDKALADERDAARAELDETHAKLDAAVEKLRQDKLQTARKLKAMNLSTEQIADATGLSADEIAAL